jgi:hypothetical protein
MRTLSFEEPTRDPTAWYGGPPRDPEVWLPPPDRDPDDWPPPTPVEHKYVCMVCCLVFLTGDSNNKVDIK